MGLDQRADEGRVCRSESNFTGLSLPDGAWLPPELIYLLPNISGLDGLLASQVLERQVEGQP